MLELIKRWFRSDLAPDPGSSDATALPDRLKELEREAEQDRLGLRGTPLNHAGDLCMKVKDKERALKYYGRAIDTYLDDGRPELARGVAQKLIRVHPGAVRTYCTLTWLDLGLGHLADARSHVGGYVAAARRVGREDLAIPQVQEMAHLVTDLGFLETVATCLYDLGERTAERELRSILPSSPERQIQDADVSERCFAAAKSSGQRRQGIRD